VSCTLVQVFLFRNLFWEVCIEQVSRHRQLIPVDLLLLSCAAESCQQDSTAAASPSSRPPTVLRTRSATRTPGTAPQLPAGLRKYPTPPHGKGTSAAAAAGGAVGGNIGAAAAAASLGVELPSVLRHVNFSSASSAYTPSQLLEVRRTDNRQAGWQALTGAV
jgi:hypothetical protein